MDQFQIINGFASLLAAFIWLRSLPDTLRMRRDVPYLGPITTICFGITVWYGVLNLLLGLDLLDLTQAQSVPYFRIAFPVVVLAPAFRMVLVSRIRNTLAKQRVVIRD